MHDNKLLLERYSAGEIDEVESQCIEEHCKTCTKCAGYLEALDKDRQKFLTIHPFIRFQQGIVPLPRQAWYKTFFNTLRRPALFPAYGFIVILLMLSPIIYFKGIHQRATDEITLKGGDALSFLLDRNGRHSFCTPRDTVFPGDKIQVLYSRVKGGYISLLSVDSYGSISWYHLDRGSSFCGVPVKPRRPGIKQIYPAAILLDDSKGQELIVTLFSDAPLSTAAVQQWIIGAIKKTNTNLSLLEKELDSSGNTIGAAPIMALFQKGN